MLTVKKTLDPSLFQKEVTEKIMKKSGILV